MTAPPSTLVSSRRSRTSAGLLMYRHQKSQLEVFIARPGGPWFPHRDVDFWTIPKGEVEAGESLLSAAIREFKEEVGITPAGPYLTLGSIRQKGGKTVHAWAFAGDWDGLPIQSNVIRVEWPPGSGTFSPWPEIDKAAFFPLDLARARMKIAQHPLLDRLAEALKSPSTAVYADSAPQSS